MEEILKVNSMANIEWEKVKEASIIRVSKSDIHRLGAYVKAVDKVTDIDKRVLVPLNRFYYLLIDFHPL